MNHPHIVLAKEAVFPIRYDENGSLLRQNPATRFQIPGTIQGEGKMAGVPVLFLRTAGCNLRCMWSLPNGEISLCDTPQASFHTPGKKTSSIASVKNTILHNLGKINHLVISGGEPFLQADALTELIIQLRKERPLHISIETNGTLVHQELMGLIDFFSISPKLRNSVPNSDKLKDTNVTLPFDLNQPEKIRKNISAIQNMIDHCRDHREKDFQLKFVVQHSQELNEIDTDFLSELNGWNPDDVVLMPLGSTPDEMRQTRMFTVEAAIEKGWRFSPRLQINYFNGIPGV